MSAYAFVRSKSLEYREILAVCYGGHAADSSADFWCGVLRIWRSLWKNHSSTK
jgi:hypothetical protein